MTTSKSSINIGNMIRRSPEFNMNFMMYEGDKAPWDDNGNFNSTTNKHRFYPKDIGLVMSMIKRRRDDQNFYLKLLTSRCFVGWAYEHVLVLC